MEKKKELTEKLLDKMQEILDAEEHMNKNDEVRQLVSIVEELYDIQSH